MELSVSEPWRVIVPLVLITKAAFRVIVIDPFAEISRSMKLTVTAPIADILSLLDSSIEYVRKPVAENDLWTMLDLLPCRL